MYQLDYKISTEGDSVTGTWPAEAPQILSRGRVREVGDLLALVPVGTTRPTSLTVEYTLNWVTRAPDMRRMSVGTVSQLVPISELRTGIIVVTNPAFRLTLGLIVPE